jgi:hypothetical protein
MANGLDYTLARYVLGEARRCYLALMDLFHVYSCNSGEFSCSDVKNIMSGGPEGQGEGAERPLVKI